MSTQSKKPELDEQFSISAQNWLLTKQERSLRELLARPGKVRTCCLCARFLTSLAAGHLASVPHRPVPVLRHAQAVV
jgi:hypothetical protein